MILQEAAVTTLSGFLSNIGTVLSSATGWVSTIVGVVMDTPLLLVPCALGIAFTAIHIFKALK